MSVSCWINDDLDPRIAVSCEIGMYFLQFGRLLSHLATNSLAVQKSDFKGNQRMIRENVNERILIRSVMPTIQCTQITRELKTIFCFECVYLRIAQAGLKGGKSGRNLFFQKCFMTRQQIFNGSGNCRWHRRCERVHL